MRVHARTGDKMEPQVMGGAATTSAGCVQGSSRSQPGPWQLSSVQRFRRGQGERFIPSCPALAVILKSLLFLLLAAGPETAKMDLLRALVLLEQNISLIILHTEQYPNTHVELKADRKLEYHAVVSMF